MPTSTATPREPSCSSASRPASLATKPRNGGSPAMDAGATAGGAGTGRGGGGGAGGRRGPGVGGGCGGGRGGHRARRRVQTGQPPEVPRVGGVVDDADGHEER